MKKHYNVDGDVLVFRAAWKSESVHDWGNDLYSVVADLNEARGHYDHILASIVGDNEYTVVFSDPDSQNFRYEVFEDYKSARHSTGSRKPLVYRDLRRELIETRPERHTYLPCVEGDDVLGILQTADTVCCTIDKDLQCIPGSHYNFDKDEYTEVTHQEAYEFFLRQALAGDATDGIPGIRGVGLKTAEKILTKRGYSWQSVVDEYVDRGLSEEFALMNARLVRILTPALWNYKDHAPILWTPEMEGAE
ncbi:MAG: putative ribonuclease H [Prokaryotic dsDNA virus sp.]|nr:MAG: putative ribonuclease H [Prokaryotic dsDNA virus sp.]|tara:strand:- start:31129 stop:31875 length:747 start_codon:yes stop_codon:yes gene_type:complete